jgi:hypothetical protein
MANNPYFRDKTILKESTYLDILKGNVAPERRIVKEEKETESKDEKNKDSE